MVCYEGKCAEDAWPYDFTSEGIAPTCPDSLEAPLHRRAAAFVNLRADPREEAFVMRGREHGQEHM